MNNNSNYLIVFLLLLVSAYAVNDVINNYDLYYNKVNYDYSVCNNTSTKDMYLVNFTGTSMIPTIMPGSKVYLKVIPINESIVVRSIVSANNKESNVTVGHRVVSVDIDTDVIVLRGDNNFVEDKYHYQRRDVNYYVCGVLF